MIGGERRVVQRGARPECRGAVGVAGGVGPVFCPYFGASLAALVVAQ
jgi:hypothetical protein